MWLGVDVAVPSGDSGGPCAAAHGHLVCEGLTVCNDRPECWKGNTAVRNAVQTPLVHTNLEASLAQ